MKTLGLCLLTTLGLAQHVSPPTRNDMEKFVGCPAEGTYRNGSLATGRLRALNLLKNRFESPTVFDPSVTLSKMSEPGPDAPRWDPTKSIGARVTGYVAFMIQNFEGESCNCFKLDDAHSDTHIDLVVHERDWPVFSSHVIVEVTPRMKFLAKKRGLDWSTTGLGRQFLHKWVTVEGWLMWDGEHQMQARNTHPLDPDGKNWRVTCWEVHPVTNIVLAKTHER